jgi:hypothetical protein
LNKEQQDEIKNVIKGTLNIDTFNLDRNGINSKILTSTKHIGAAIKRTPNICRLKSLKNRSQT